MQLVGEDLPEARGQGLAIRVGTHRVERKHGQPSRHWRRRRTRPKMLDGKSCRDQRERGGERDEAPSGEQGPGRGPRRGPRQGPRRELVENVEQLAGGLEPILWLLGEAAAHHRSQWLRDDVWQRCWIPVEDGVAGLHVGGARERGRPGQHLVKDGSEREHVGAPIRLLAADLLRRHVWNRPQVGARLGSRPAGACGSRGGSDRGQQLRHPEVEDLQAAVLEEEEVRRLEVAMNDALLMCGREAARELQRQRQRFIRR